MPTPITHLCFALLCFEQSPRLSKSLKVIGSDTDRSATYDFLLTSHNTVGLSRTISDTDGDFNRKSQIFIGRIFEGFPLEFDNADSAQKLE